MILLLCTSFSENRLPVVVQELLLVTEEAWHVTALVVFIGIWVREGLRTMTEGLVQLGVRQVIRESTEKFKISKARYLRRWCKKEIKTYAGANWLPLFMRAGC